MTAAPMTPTRTDPRGEAYDDTWVDDFGTRHYRRDQALGTACGSATWSDRYHYNPICGDPLAAKCTGCQTCLDCTPARCSGR
jgi:hypothetical protein